MPAQQKILSAFDFTKDSNHIERFLKFNITAFERLLRQKDEQFWQQQGQRKALRLFHATAQRIPAYKDFLRRNKVHPERIKTFQDFEQLPVTDKKNYIQQYPLQARSWDGEVRPPTIVAVSSGTSGEPNFWPRATFQEFETGVIHELIYRYLFAMDKHKSLLIIGFPMGVYVSGIATVLPSFAIAAKGYPLTIATAGNNKGEFLRIVKKLQNSYEQLVLIGHPFFIKDVIETGRQAGINWSRKKLKMLFCSEGFSESWRQYVLAKAGLNPSGYDIINTYGSSELLLMAHETPLTIALRRLMESNVAFRQELIDERPVPNLFQYNPLWRYIECVNDELIFTSASGIPLIRFNLRDAGKIIKFSEIKDALKLERTALARGPKNKKAWRLPLVALWGRSDYTVIFYAANIYPEHLHLALNYKPLLNKITGKFALAKGYLKNMDEFLEINIELASGIAPSKRLHNLVLRRIVTKLLEINSEYADASSRLGKKLIPRIKLWPYQHPQYFKPGLKPRYILG